MSAANSCPDAGRIARRRGLNKRLATAPLLAAAAVLLAAPLVTSGQSLREGIDSRLPISLDADSSEFDRRNNLMIFRGLRITQGTIGIEADRGQTLFGGDSSPDFRDSVWRFEGDVKIDVDTTNILCDSAELTFRDHRLSSAVATGDPARFRDYRPEEGTVTTGRAGRFEYDVTAGRVTLTGDARISEGSNTIAGDLLVYDLNQQVVTARGGEGEDGKVSLTIVPEEVEKRLDDDEAP
ncbi:MAG TPA: lipopolysaccharide transport periplasmic protein LptA [Woeseiaceae bacterium]|nr:lipopolysaccharide transport periplasmic protein LptA [Woeseiaceae bacterium]